MILSNTSRRLALALTATALVLALQLVAASSAEAQPLPAIFYGKGLIPNQQVEVLIEGRSCGTTTVNRVGEWVIMVPPDAPCAPTDGAPVTFKVAGRAAEASPPAIWEIGGTPSDIANGYAFNLPPSPDGPEDDQTPSPGSQGTASPGATQGASSTPGAFGTGAAATSPTATTVPSSQQEDDDGGGGGPWLILAVVAIVVAAAAGGGFYYYRRRQAAG